MCAFIDDFIFDSRQAVEYHGSRSTFDVVEGSLGEGDTDGDGDGVAVDGVEGAGHGVGSRLTSCSVRWLVSFRALCEVFKDRFEEALPAFSQKMSSSNTA